MNGLLQAFKKQSVNSYYDLQLNHETAAYIYRILSIKDLLKNPKKYGMKVKSHRVEKIRKMIVEKDIKDLSKFASDNKTSITELKELNPWLLKNTLTIKEPGKSYILLLPDNKALQSDLKKDTSSRNALSYDISWM
jgi:membrane-bound lytic murein transglycosylase D